jgi:hypothetical protein
VWDLLLFAKHLLVVAKLRDEFLKMGGDARFGLPLTCMLQFTTLAYAEAHGGNEQMFGAN